MKLEYYNINDFIIYLNNDYIKKYNLKLEENAQDNFKKLLNKLKSIYNLELYGYYKINVYINKYYGIIIELFKEDDEYIKIFGDSLDLKILFKNDAKVYYEIEEYNKYNLDKYNIYYYNNKFYIEIIYNNNIKEYLNLLESSKIIYGTQLEKIINNLIKI